METLLIGRPPRRQLFTWATAELAVDVALCVGAALLLTVALAFG